MCPESVGSFDVSMLNRHHVNFDQRMFGINRNGAVSAVGGAKPRRA
jgi:hypothetical protein